MKDSVRWYTLLLVTALLIGAFVYYFHLSRYLSFNGGPDEASHYHAARFIAEHGRLAVYPDDEASLHISREGITFFFRSPLAYATSALGSRLLQAREMPDERRFRVSSALFGSLSVALVFLAAVTLTGSTWLGLFGALSFGLMPQLTFLSVYVNDDIAAVAVAALLLCSLIALTRRGVSPTLVMLTGFAVGLVIISKPSAWVVAIPLTLAALWLVARSRIGAARRMFVLTAVAAAVGGWWLLFNIYHHGLDDPLNQGVEKEVVAKHREFVPPEGRSYAEQKIGVIDLLADRDDFMTDTFKSTVGNLDWLRLEMGRVQYGFYAVLFVIAGVGWLYGLFAPRRGAAASRAVFMLLLAAVALQFLAYLWVNLSRFAQPQGRYLLPSMPIVMTMAVYGLYRIAGSLRHFAWGGVLQGAALRTSTLSLLLLAPVYVHLEGFVHHVLPFYRLPDYYGLDASHFDPWYPGWSDVPETNQLSLDRQGNAVVVRSTGNDPWLLFGPEQASALTDGAMLRISLDSQANGHFSVYWDEGSGLSETLMASRHYNVGTQTIYLRLDTRSPVALRLDPMTRPGSVTIHQIAVASIDNEPLSVLDFLGRLR